MICKVAETKSLTTYQFVKNGTSIVQRITGINEYWFLWDENPCVSIRETT